MEVERIAAFSYNNEGGNPAGVVFCDAMPDASDMLKIAEDVGYSETAFLHPFKDGWRVRYFAPEMEVPFCGHATIATGYALGEKFGQGDYKLYLNDDTINVVVEKINSEPLFVTLNSPETFSEFASPQYVDKILHAFDYKQTDLSQDFPVHFASAGAKHLIIVLAEHQKLSDMAYDYEIVKDLMAEESLITVNLLWKASSNLFHSRNPFPPGGVYEDPATGAAAAAFAGYLRDIAWTGSTSFEVLQGESMGSPSKLLVEYQPEVGSSIKVSGQARRIVT